MSDVSYCETCGYGSGGHDDWCESYQEMERKFLQMLGWRNEKDDEVKELYAENERLRKDILSFEEDCARHLATEERLRDALSSLLDGLDSNHDERCGLTSEEWEKLIKAARKTLRDEDYCLRPKQQKLLEKEYWLGK